MAVDRFVFSPRLRRWGTAYVVLTVPMCAAASWSVEGQADTIRVALAAGALYAVPCLVLALIASMRAAPSDRLIWRLWALGFAVGTTSAVIFWFRAQNGWEGWESFNPTRAAAAIVLLITANTLILQRRAGQRAAVVDAVDLLMATIAVTVPFALLWADDIVESRHAWFTVSAALWFVVSVHGLFVALVMRARIAAHDRTNAHIGIVLALVGIASTVLSVRYALGGFQGPSGPAIGGYAAMVGTTMLFFLYSAQRSSRGLERLPPAAQVRRQSLVVIGVLASVPVIAIQAWFGRDEQWVTTTALVAVGSMLALSSVRHLLSARETTRLYAQVERAAAERGELLAEVMAHMDDGRARVAAHLHREAVSLYTSMVALTGALEDPSDSGNASATAAERLRADLGRRADSLRRISLAVRPVAPPGGRTESHGLAAPIRAYLENLYSDDPRPEVDIRIDPRLDLDWTTEAILVRILQEASSNVWRHAQAQHVTVDIGTERGTIYLEVIDDGVGCAQLREHKGIDTMRRMARFMDGDVSISSVPGLGTRVRAEFDIDMLPERPRPQLRLVDR